MITRTYKQNTWGFKILFKITDADTNEPRNISGFDPVFKMWKPGEFIPKIVGDCVITSGLHGECTYRVERVDFDSYGIYNAEIQLTKNGIVERTESFQVTIIESSTEGYCYENIYPYDGEIDIQMLISSGIELDYAYFGDIIAEFTISSSCSFGV